MIQALEVNLVQTFTSLSNGRDHQADKRNPTKLSISMTVITLRTVGLITITLREADQRLTSLTKERMVTMTSRCNNLMDLERRDHLPDIRILLKTLVLICLWKMPSTSMKIQRKTHLGLRLEWIKPIKREGVTTRITKI